MTASATTAFVDQEAALRLTPVSRETRRRLALYVEALHRWQPVQNLVAANTLPLVWTRHIADSIQLLDHASGAKKWLDLGSGAGFPGLVLAIVLAERADAMVDLVESNGRKCAFLREVIRETGAPARLHEGRLEGVVGAFSSEVDVVTARALAPLSQLLAWTAPLLRHGVMGLFPKGKEAMAELTEAAKSWKFTAELLPSRTDSHARIVRVTSLEEEGADVGRQR